MKSCASPVAQGPAPEPRREPRKAPHTPRAPAGDELLTREDVARIARVSRTKSFEIWAQLDKIVLGGRCVRVRRTDLERYFDDARRRAWR